MDDVEARRAKRELLRDEAAQVAAELVGLTAEDARARVAQHGDLSIRFAGERRVMTADVRFRRITAMLQDGAVVSAHAG